MRACQDLNFQRGVAGREGVTCLWEGGGGGGGGGMCGGGGGGVQLLHKKLTKI